LGHLGGYSQLGGTKRYIVSLGIPRGNINLVHLKETVNLGNLGNPVNL
jgi:hypothetical protein